MRILLTGQGGFTKDLYGGLGYLCESGIGDTISRSYLLADGGVPAGGYARCQLRLRDYLTRAQDALIAGDRTDNRLDGVSGLATGRRGCLLIREDGWNDELIGQIRNDGRLGDR